ncbi:MAG: hypothetical protein JXR50_12765 [Prolixibacteraceae bacterium]|nr:hypothetical protein [Prolixibacteraceae bacterium]MBN2650607.1 hypothetical protein [Prolixibacteraceae bacterium]
MKKITTILALLLANIAFSQDFYDALRYSQTEYGGTARSIAMGSAFGAVGGDFISASINPAGLGLYRSDEFTISPSLNANSIDAYYLKNNESDNQYKFIFNNIGYVTSVSTGAEYGITSVNLGFGFNRLKNFHSNSLIKGYNAKTTLLNYYSDYANIYGHSDYFDDFHEGLAWKTQLLEKDEDSFVLEGVFYNDLTDYEPYDLVNDNNEVVGIGYEAVDVFPHQQKALISKSGKMDEYLFSLGINYNHKVYFGASVGLVDIEYSEDILYMEIDDQEQSEYLNNFTVDQQINESGFGANFKAGIIVRPFKSLRLGASVHTPTFFTINHNDYKSISSEFDQKVGKDEDNRSTKWFEDEEPAPYDYKFESPFKANFSVAFVFNQYAIISMDYEIANYGSMKFRHSGDNFDYSDKNSAIGEVYNTTGNLRIGGEFRATPNFSLRAGYNFIGNPWNETYTYSNGNSEKLLNSTDKYSAYSAGFGYRQQNFFIDFAYKLNQSEYAYKVHETYYTNPTGGTATATLTELNHQATLTLGFRF